MTILLEDAISTQTYSHTAGEGVNSTIIQCVH